MVNSYKGGGSVASSLASSGPHQAVAVFARAFPPVKDRSEFDPWTEVKPP